jgi:hypothetical protein
LAIPGSNRTAPLLVDPALPLADFFDADLRGSTRMVQKNTYTFSAFIVVSNPRPFSSIHDERTRKSVRSFLLYPR